MELLLEVTHITSNTANKQTNSSEEEWAKIQQNQWQFLSVTQLRMILMFSLLLQSDTLISNRNVYIRPLCTTKYNS